MSAFGRQILTSDEYIDCNGIHNYLTVTEEGKKLKCSVLFIRDKKNDLIGMICINIDITRLEIAKNTLEEVIGLPNVTSPSKINPRCAVSYIDRQNIVPSKNSCCKNPIVIEERFYKEISDTWDQLLSNVKRSFPTPLARLSPQEMRCAIEQLHNEGFFLVKGSIQILAKELKKSRYTIYGHLRKIREKDKKQRIEKESL